MGVGELGNSGYQQSPQKASGRLITLTFLIGPLLLDFLDPGSFHRRQELFCVDCKTYTKPGTFVRYVIKFADVTKPMPILSLCGPHNC